MKKQLVLLGTLLAAVILFGTVAHAATAVPGSARTITATAALAGTPVAQFGIKLRPAADPDGVAADLTTISWSGLTAGITTWKAADVVLRTTWTVTDVGGGITIYTDNTNAAALPKFVDPTPGNIHDVGSDPGGLLLGTAGNSSVGLAMAWAVKASSQVIGTQLVAADPNGVKLVPPDPNAAQWFNMLDKASPGIDTDGDGWNPLTDPVDTKAFVYGQSFATMMKNTGIHFSQSDDSTNYGADPDFKSYVYLQANFATAGASQTYQTSRLTVEAYLQ